MNRIKTALIKLWTRIWEESPKYFARMAKYSLWLIGLIGAMKAVAPGFDIILFTLYKGTENEQVVWLTHAVAAFAAGMAYVAPQVVKNYDTYQNKVRNKINNSNI